MIWFGLILLILTFGVFAGPTFAAEGDESVCRFLPIGVQGAVIDPGTLIDDGAACRADLIIGERDGLPDDQTTFVGVFTVDITPALSFSSYYESVAAEGSPSSAGHVGAFTNEVISVEFSNAEIYIVFCRGDWVGHVFHSYDTSGAGADTSALALEMASDIDSRFISEGAVGCADGSATGVTGQGVASEGETGQSVESDQASNRGGGGGVPWPAIVIGGVLIAGVGVISRSRRGASSNESVDQDDRDDDEDDSRVLLELTYPAGQSPYVFEHGWVFGARCIVESSSGQRDISDDVKWSGTGTFVPPVGRLSRPSFEFEDGLPLGRGARSTGTIILTVEVDGVVSERSYPVAIVSPYGYAAVGDRVVCEADAHACPTCPHVTEGRIAAGSPNVQIKDLPAARVGDGGYAAVCCGSGMFTVTSGDPTVLINGRHAAMVGSSTANCGGQGRITTGYGV